MGDGEKQEKQTSPRPPSTSSPSPGFDFPENEETTPSNSDEASLCSNTHLDTIFRTESGDGFPKKDLGRLVGVAKPPGCRLHMAGHWSHLHLQGGGILEVHKYESRGGLPKADIRGVPRNSS